MKLPLSWIKEVIDINASPQQIAKLLTHAGLEVENLSPLPLKFEKVVVGEVTHVEKHPNADKLLVATVSDGRESRQVVCGAPNCREGIKTAYALVGATLTGEDGKVFKVNAAKLRGIESNGMLCSEKELGISDQHEGIMEFAEHIKPGADVAEIYSDVVFEISLTPNLGHCASVIGVARELSAATTEKITLPAIEIKEDTAQPVSDAVSVSISSPEKCPRYCCRIIKGVNVGPSPSWIQKRLLACDFRPVNNIVDITNYVLLEMGHPLHAFDYDTIEGSKILVRTSNEGETFLTLDGKKRSLACEDLLICDQKKPIAIAGVMGGLNTEVGDSTVNILLEAALFEPKSIRRTAKRLALQTEASRRFEKGCDPNNLVRALDRATMLIQQCAGGTVCAGIVDAKEKEFVEKTVSCRLSRINQILGTRLGLSEVEGIFQRLEMAYAWDGKDLFTVKPPSYRVDISEEVDLVEEVARIYGFDSIPKKHPQFTSSLLPHAPMYLFENEVRRRMVAEGLQEFITCDLIGPTLLDIVKEHVMPVEERVKVLNPKSIEQSVLRTSLLPGLLEVVKYNYAHGAQDISGFEIGRIHFKKNEKYIEQSVVGIILSGGSQPYHWEDKPGEAGFFDLKGIIENFLSELRAGSPKYKNNNLPIFHPGRQAAISIGSLEIGTLGEVHPSILRRLDVPQRIVFAELDLHDLYQVRKTDLKMAEIPIYPSSTRDLTLTLADTIPAQAIFDAINALNSPLLESVNIVDIFKSDKLGKGRKNVTLHFVYRDKKKTVSQEAVEAEHAKITTQTQSLF